MEARPLAVAPTGDGGDDDDDNDDDNDGCTFHRWPLPHLRRQLLESRTALSRCEARVIASARAAATAQESLGDVQRKRETMKVQMEVLHRELIRAEQDAADLVGPVGDRLVSAKKEAARDRERREAAEAARNEAEMARDAARSMVAEALAKGEEALAKARGEHTAALLEARAAACAQGEAALAELRAQHEATLADERTRHEAARAAWREPAEALKQEAIAARLAAAAERDKAEAKLAKAEVEHAEATAITREAKEVAEAMEAQLDLARASASRECERRLAAEAARDEAAAALAESGVRTRQALGRFKSRLESLQYELSSRATHVAARFERLSRLAETLRREAFSLDGGLGSGEGVGGVGRLAVVIHELQQEIGAAALESATVVEPPDDAAHDAAGGGLTPAGNGFGVPVAMAPLTPLPRPLWPGTLSSLAPSAEPSSGFAGGGRHGTEWDDGAGSSARGGTSAIAAVAVAEARQMPNSELASAIPSARRCASGSSGDDSGGGGGGRTSASKPEPKSERKRVLPRGSASALASKAGAAGVSSEYKFAMAQGTQEEVRRLRRELREARDELHSASGQQQRTQSLIAKYQQSILGLQAAQSEREMVYDQQLRAAVAEATSLWTRRVNEAQAVVRAELEVEMARRLTHAEKQHAKALEEQQTEAERRAERMAEEHRRELERRDRELERRARELELLHQQHEAGVQRATAALAEQQRALAEARAEAQRQQPPPPSPHKRPHPTQAAPPPPPVQRRTPLPDRSPWARSSTAVEPTQAVQPPPTSISTAGRHAAAASAGGAVAAMPNVRADESSSWGDGAVVSTCMQGVRTDESSSYTEQPPWKAVRTSVTYEPPAHGSAGHAACAGAGTGTYAEMGAGAATSRRAEDEEERSTKGARILFPSSFLLPAAPPSQQPPHLPTPFQPAPIQPAPNLPLPAQAQPQPPHPMPRPEPEPSGGSTFVDELAALDAEMRALNASIDQVATRLGEVRGD